MGPGVGAEGVDEDEDEDMPLFLSKSSQHHQPPQQPKAKPGGGRGGRGGGKSAKNGSKGGSASLNASGGAPPLAPPAVAVPAPPVEFDPRMQIVGGHMINFVADLPPQSAHLSSSKGHSQSSGGDGSKPS